MVVSKDQDLLSTLKNGVTFVCFRPGENVFFTLSYEVPSHDSFVRVESSNAYQAYGLFWYAKRNQESKLDAMPTGAILLHYVVPERFTRAHRPDGCP
jgi:hypothetical protein